MRILFDTNVILDVLLDREPFSSTAAKLFSKVETGEITGYVCATTITTLHYLSSKAIGADLAIEEINKLMMLFEVAPINRSVLDAALSAGFKDFVSYFKPDIKKMETTSDMGIRILFDVIKGFMIFGIALFIM